MFVLERLVRTLFRLFLLAAGLVLALVFLAFALTFGLLIWAWLAWRGVPVRPVQWTQARFRAASASRMWGGSTPPASADVVDVEAVVRPSDSPGHERLNPPRRP